MREHIVIPLGAVNASRLDSDLRATFGNSYSGFSKRPDTQGIILIFDDTVTPKDFAAAEAIITTHDPTQNTPEQQARADLKAAAQSAVGVAFTALTTAQLKALLATLILESGGLANDLTIKPLGEWLRD